MTKMQVLVTQKEKRDLEEAAGALGISSSRFMAQAALHEAELALSVKRGVRAFSEGLEARQQEILRLVVEREKTGPIAMGAISERLGIVPAVLSRIVSAMQRQELVWRENRGRRGQFVSLTEKGRQVWAIIGGRCQSGSKAL